MISIHALVKSATYVLLVPGAPEKNFNPRAREERDAIHILRVFSATNFNPRAREERDISRQKLLTLLISFQSTRS